MRHVTHTSEACHTYECVTSHRGTHAQKAAQQGDDEDDEDDKDDVDDEMPDMDQVCCSVV